MSLSIAELVVPWKRFGRWTVAVLLVAAALGIGHIVVDEIQSSRRQAAWLGSLARSLTFQVQAGPSAAIRFPGIGPFDQRLGYHALPERIEHLQRQGFEVTAQARMSPKMLELHDEGLFATYHEKTQAGLELRDCRDESLFAARHPERVYERFEAIPPLLVASLLFIENRELLDSQPMRNPAVEWRRFGKAMVDQLLRRVDESYATVGGSTLATQIEKYRHSPEGRTETAKDKLRQMASASLRSYLDGENTLARRREIVLDYLNTVPLSAQAGFGDVNGLGDGLWAWYGREFAEVNRLLAAPMAEIDPHRPRRSALAFKQALVPRQALAFKQALSLMVAQRRPSRYLTEEEKPVLRELTDSYLRVMADAGIITPALRDAALPLSLTLQRQPVAERPVSFVERKAATALRGKLQSLLAMPRAYDLDRLDLTVDSSLSGEVQHVATTLLRSLNKIDAAKAAGLYGFHLLSEGDDTSKIVFSFTLFERGEGVNLLRAQTDNLDQPFDLNEGARLDLGSTAKLRTLITYLEQIAELHGRWSKLDAQQLAALDIGPNDPIAGWARDHLARTDDRSLPAMLDAAMRRTYSASPYEGFFTGGGLHHFENFEPRDNHRTMSVQEAFTRSVNLVFIRLMRDVVHHVMAASAESGAELLANPANPGRREVLSRFADKEGQLFIARFYRKYASKPRHEAEDLLLQSIRPTPVRLASMFYGLEPEAGAQQLAQFLAQRLPDAQLSVQALHEKYGPGRWSLTDRGYLAGVHPLELWVVGFLRQHPKATLGAALAASRAERQEVYGWLFKTRHKGAQDVRIRSLLELQAFLEIQRAWKRLGYPFESLTPSYATALGASGDRPAALAELMGIIVNRGMRLPVTRVRSLHFASATPYETRLDYRAPHAERVLSAEVADVVRRALIGVVDEGTAKRLKGALARRDGSVVEIGGKTGTGDHRFDVYGRGGQLISSRVVDRSATLVFLIGDRYFGTIMAYAHEPFAANYKFTSAMPVQLLKALRPSLLSLIEGSTCDRAPDARRDQR
jgi:membrane peptidoglycan carboxypeptidase